MGMLFLCSLLTYNILCGDAAYQSWRQIGWQFTENSLIIFLTLKKKKKDSIASCIQDYLPSNYTWWWGGGNASLFSRRKKNDPKGIEGKSSFK